MNTQDVPSTFEFPSRRFMLTELRVPFASNFASDYVSCRDQRKAFQNEAETQIAKWPAPMCRAGAGVATKFA